MSFIVNEENHDEFKMWQGLQGPYYTPYVSENGVISWTNNGGLQNPPDVNIKGDPGAGLEISGTAETVGDLPETAEEYSIYLVGTSEPYYGYIYADGEWTNIGEIGKGETGEGVPTGGTTGQVLAKASGADYDTEWKTPDPGVDPATSTPLMDGTAAVGTATKYAREDHVHPVYDQIVRPNLLDNWYFVGGGSQQGGGQFPINQRGQASYSNAGYTIDRFLQDAATVAFASDGLSVTPTQWYGRIFQRLETGIKKAISGQTLTITALFKNSVGSSVRLSLFNETSGDTIFASDYISITNNSELVTISGTATGYQPTDTISVLIYADYNVQHTTTIAAFKLELGTTQTLAHQENGVWVLNEIPNFADELARCQRYFYKTQGSWVMVRSVMYDANRLFFMLPLPVQMRDAPSAASINALLSGSTAKICQYGSWSAVSGFSCTECSLNISGLKLVFEKTSHGLTDAYIQLDNGATLSADL